MLYAYCDESGHERQDQFMFLAGFVGNEDQWKLNDKKWNESGGGEGFHTKNVVRKPTRAEPKLARLSSVPLYCGLRPIVGGVRMSDYWDLVSGTQFERRAKGWCVALYPLVLETILFIPKNERVEFIFDEQCEYQPFAERAMEAISEFPNERLRTENGSPKLASLRFVHRERTIRTQPADFLAFALRSFFREPQSDAARLTRPILDCIASSRRIGEIFSREKVRLILRSMPTLGLEGGTNQVTREETRRKKR